MNVDLQAKLAAYLTTDGNITTDEYRWALMQFLGSAMLDDSPSTLTNTQVLTCGFLLINEMLDGEIGMSVGESLENVADLLDLIRNDLDKRS